MTGILKLLAGLVSLIHYFVRLTEQRKLEREARERAEGAVAKAELKRTHEAAEIVAEHRADDAAARRLQDGSF